MITNDIIEIRGADGQITRLERSGEFSWRATRNGKPVDWLAIMESASKKSKSMHGA